MKKRLLLLMLAVFSTSFIACNKDDDDDDGQKCVLKGTRWSCDQLDENKSGSRITYNFNKDHEFIGYYESIENGVTQKVDSDNDGEIDDLYYIENGAYIIENSTIKVYFASEIITFTFKSDDIMLGSSKDRDNKDIFYEFKKTK